MSATLSYKFRHWISLAPCDHACSHAVGAFWCLLFDLLAVMYRNHVLKYVYTTVFRCMILYYRL